VLVAMGGLQSTLGECRGGALSDLEQEQVSGSRAGPGPAGRVHMRCRGQPAWHRAQLTAGTTAGRKAQTHIYIYIYTPQLVAVS